jgi:RNA recognition motif-containing protein
MVLIKTIILNNGFNIIRCETEEEAQKAIERMHGKVYYDDCN